MESRDATEREVLFHGFRGLELRFHVRILEGCCQGSFKGL